ncbi:hypothetical protein Tco_0653346 [Tanacetum coccineum]|uniref:Uncharacterized protein n=1 Tax=Tanacetum coccineum TaxID=301880 RepID=A0ABQ4X043_9ASTR
MNNIYGLVWRNIDRRIVCEFFEVRVQYTSSRYLVMNVSARFQSLWIQQRYEAITKLPRLQLRQSEKYLGLASIPDRQESFEELNGDWFCSILTLPSGFGGYQIYSDASKKGFGCVLKQPWKCTNVRWLLGEYDIESNLMLQIKEAQMRHADEIPMCKWDMISMDFVTGFQPDMSLSEEPESILDRQERDMRTKVIPFVKIPFGRITRREAYPGRTGKSMRARLCKKLKPSLSFLRQVLSYDESKSRRVSEHAFMTLFAQDNETFTSTMFLYVDQLQNQLDKDEFQEDKSMAAFWVLNNQFQKFIDWQYFLDYNSEMTEKNFVEYTGIKVKQFRETLLLHMGNVKKSIAERTRHKRHGTKSDEHITSSNSGTYITHVADADIRPVNDQVPSAEVHLTAQHNVLADEQLHTDQSEQSYDTYLLEKVNSNTTPDSTNMCHRGGEIDQDAEQYKVKSPLLNAELVKSKEMIEKETYNELSRRFLLLEKHCISLEISIQQKEESFQSNKPCKNQDAPEFHEFFEINDLKAQLQAKTTLICNLKNQIKSVKEASNEAKVKNDIDVIETINIELEHNVAKLLAANEQLHKENEHLKQTYKELYDSIKKTHIPNKDNSDSLIYQINQKSVENADLKAQIQEKVFANAALKNELRKLKGNSMDTKFAKASILGKPPLQPSRNHSVVRQPNAFKSERPRISKPRFASQVDEINVLSKPVTPHYLPKVREYVLVKPHHVIAPGSSRNSQEESYGSNDMAHYHYLEEARKKTQERNRNSKPSVMPSIRLQNTANDSTPNPKRMNQTSRSLPTSKSSYVTITVVPKADHSRNSSSFSDSKHFFCSTCHKCVFNANHDACITKLLNEVNSCKVKPHKTKNSNNPVEQKSHTQKPGRQIFSGHRFSPKKTSAVYEKTSPRSCLRWKPTSKIFTAVGLKWITTRKLFDSCTSKVDSEPPNGSNDDITNPYECDQTLNVSAGTLNLSAGLALQRQMASADNTSDPAPQRKESSRLGPQLMTLGTTNSRLVQNIPSPTPAVPPTKIDWDSLFQPRFDEYFKPPSNVDHPVLEVPIPVPAASTSSPSSTTVDQDAPSTSTSQTTSKQQSSVIPQGVEDDFYDIEVAHMDNDPYFGIPIPEPSSEETTLQGVIPSNLHHLNQSFDTLTKLTKKHPLENVIGDPSRPVLTRSQLQEHAIWCYFDANDNPIPFGGKRSG